MIVGFTGTRRGMTTAQKDYLRAVLAAGGVEEFHHGDCVGADEEAHAIARALHIPIIIHPPILKHLRAWCEGAKLVHRVLPYLHRNHALVNSCALLYAAPATDDVDAGRPADGPVIPT
jgi:hypothetical protein